MGADAESVFGYNDNGNFRGKPINFKLLWGLRLWQQLDIVFRTTNKS